MSRGRHRWDDHTTYIPAWWYLIPIGTILLSSVALRLIWSVVVWIIPMP
jgi:hypothetical protein